MIKRTYIFSAALLLAGCSSAAQAAPNTAIVAQGGPAVVSSFDAVSAGNPTLDGAPPVAAAPLEPTPLAPPPIMVLAPAPVAPPVVVVKKVQRLSCDIEVKRTSNGIRVTPVVRSDRSLSGEFSLTITKDGAGGSSDISQGGPFDAARGERVKLSSSEFSMERGAKFRAVLKVRAGGEEVCRDISS